jgi:3-dehydroquinate dehydratase-2
MSGPGAGLGAGGLHAVPGGRETAAEPQRGARPIFVLNGPNLGLLGQREPDTYGAATLADIEALCRAEAAQHGLGIDFRQSEHEGTLVEWLHEAHRGACAVVLNPAGYGHSSVALLDAMLAIAPPVIECHLSNLARREAFRHTTRTAAAAAGVIFGFGARSYVLAVRAAAELARTPHAA